MLPLHPSTVFLCKTIGSRWHEKITQSTERLDGTVLNVFEKTINIKMDGDELLVLSHGKNPSPITINIASEQHDSISDFVSPGDHVTVKGMGPCNGKTSNIAEISLGNALILADTADCFKNNLVRFDENSLRSFLGYDKDLFLVLAECADSRQGCLLNPDMTTKGILSEFLAHLDDTGAFDIADPRVNARLCRALLMLCGRGPGFTPAGDDFISGFITMFNSIRNGLSMGPAIIPDPEFTGLTTWTSFKLIEYNAMGLVDIQIQEFLNSAAQGNILSYVDKIRSLSKRGHTSGLDFLTGATFALYMAANSIHRRETCGSLSD